MKNLYNNIIGILKDNWVVYKEYNHWPILNYEDALKEKSIHNWNWFESKNVFMTNKKWKYFLFVTVEWQKVDFKYLKEIFQEKLSLASFEEVKNIILCIPWCVAPFWFSKEIVTIVDKDIFNLQGNYLFSPWVADKTIELNILDLKGIFNNINNTIFI
jgi:Ala-tRNA(Pro) deacylase